MDASGLQHAPHRSAHLQPTLHTKFFATFLPSPATQFAHSQPVMATPLLLLGPAGVNAAPLLISLCGGSAGCSARCETRSAGVMRATGMTAPCAAYSCEHSKKQCCM